MSDYYVDYDGNITTKKNKKKKQSKTSTNYTVGYDGKVSKAKKEDNDDIAPVIQNIRDKKEEMSPVLRLVRDKKAEQAQAEAAINTVLGKDKKDSRTWFNKPEYFDDGYDRWDVLKTVGATLGDIGENVAKGVASGAEGVVDWAATTAVKFGGLFGSTAADEYMAKQLKKDQKNAKTKAQKKAYQKLIDNAEKGAKSQKEAEKNVAKFVAKDIIKEDKIDFGLDENSVLGEKSDDLVQSAGQVAVQIGADVLAPGSGLLLMGASAFGSEAENALQNGATLDEAMKSAAISAGAEMLTEKLGGIKFGGKTATDAIFQKFSYKITNKLTKVLASTGKLIAGGTAEGIEELLSGYISAIGQKMTYMKDYEIEELFNKDAALESFIGGFVLGGTFDIGGSLITGRNNVTGLTKNEQSVIDKVFDKAVAEKETDGTKLTNREKSKLYNTIIENMDKGQIDIDTIESVLGGDDYKAYKEVADFTDGLTKEADELGNKQNPTLADQYKYSNLMQRLKDSDAKRSAARAKLDSTMSPLLKNSRLAESYNERARRSQAFEADLSHYEEAQRAAVERAIKSGVLNNTNRSHELVNVLSRIEADKGIIFDYTNNEKLKELGYAIEGKTVNGFASKSKGSVTLNVQSAKAWQSTVGHEIGHILKGTDAFAELQNTLFKYAESKGELASRKAELTKLYKNIDTDIDEELTCDLIGDYLFTDKAFIDHLTGNERLFKKVYNEVKYLCKVATGKELTEIEKVRREFDRAWKQMSVKGVTAQKNATQNNSINYSISKTQYMDWNEQINGLLKKQGQINRSDTLVIEKNTPAYLQSDIIENLPLAVPISVVTKATKGKDISHSIKNENLVSLQKGIRNADIIIKNPERKSFVFVTNIKQDGYPILVSFEQNAMFDGDRVHKATSIHLQIDVNSMLEALPETATVYFKNKKELNNVVGVTNNLRSLAANVEFIDEILPQNGSNVNIQFDNPDVRFSLSESVEETKDLVAVHNLQSSELAETLKLGGLPMPSIAIIKAQQSHEDYGDVSLIFSKNTIDPKKNKSNKVYGGDAWTPTYPSIEYKVNEKAQKAIRNKINSLVPYDVQRGLGFLALDYDNMTNDLNRHNGDIVRVYENNYAMQYAFLVDNGFDEQLPTAEKHLDGSGRFGNSLIVDVAKNLGDAEVIRLANELSYQNNAEIDKLRDMANESFKSKYAGNGELLKALRSKPFYNDTNFGFAQADSIIRAAYNYIQNGFEQTVDYKKATDVIKNAVDETAYKKWLSDLFVDVVEKEGIRNNKDIFTPSGNRRSWDALHWENTLENVVKAMKAKEQTGADAFAPFSAMFAVANKKYSSVDEIKADSHRLGEVSEEEYESLKTSYSNRFGEIAASIKNRNASNDFIAMDNAADLIVEAVRNYKTKSAMLKYMREYNNRVTESTVDDIFSLVSDISNMPTGYFEAKPQRAVGLDEVGVFVIPYNVDAKLKQELLSKGYSIAEYNPNIEGDRKRVVNQFEEYKFSLSKQGENIAPIGNYSTPLNETALAPTKADISKNENIKNVLAKNAVVNDAPIPSDVDAPIENEHYNMPDDYAPMTEDEANALQDELFNSITDADAPPIVEDNYYNEPDTTKIDDKALKGITAKLRETLSLTAKEARAIAKIVQDYSVSQFPSKADLFETIKTQFGERVWKEKNEEIANVKRRLRTTKISISPEIKADIADFSHFRKQNASKIKFSQQDGLPVDVAYQELVEEYPDFFDPDISNPTDQLLRIVEVANNEIYQAESYELDNDTIQEAVNIISAEVNNYKQDLTRQAAEDTAREALDSIAPAKATQLADGSRGDALLNQSLDNFPIKTVEDRLKEKIRAVEGELADNKQLRRENEANYNDIIAATQAELNAKKNKNTKTANALSQKISRLQDIQASVDADYAKRISDLEARVEKMKDPTYSRALYKQQKMQEHAKWAENLIGDTSTWKDKKFGVQYEVNTERRNLRDIVRDENGNVDIAKADAINDALNGEYNRNHAAMNREDAEISKKYIALKVNHHESVYANMLGELRHNPDTTLTEKVVKEYYEKHKNKIDAEKVDKFINYVRTDLDSFFERLNAKLREQGMKEIPYRKGYFPHKVEPKQNFIQKLLNWKTQDNEIPTSIAGLTEDFKPVKSWQSFDKQRHSDETDYDLLRLFQNYKQGALDWIYHIEDIQKRRAVENYIRFTHSDEGVQAKIKEVYANEEYDADEAQAEIEKYLAQKKNPLNNFVQNFMTHTNILTGKKNSLDRGMEQRSNRGFYNVMMNVQNRTSANMVLANVRSALTNFIPITQSWAQVSPLQSLKATKDTIANAIKDDGLINKSTFLTNRLREADSLYKTNWDKILDKAGIMFEIVDNFSAQVIWRSKYSQNLAKGMSEAAAIKNADQFAENVMAGRSKGNEPTIFNEKNPLTKAFTMFQLEVNNQYGYLFKDVPTDLKAETNHWKLNLAKGYTTAFIGAYVYNALLEQVAGSGAALDPIGIIEDLLKDLGLFGDDEEEEPVEAFRNFRKNVTEELPFIGNIVGGGRIPISSAVPYSGNGFQKGLEAFEEDASKTINTFYNGIVKGDWDEADWSGGKNILKELMNPLLNVGLPVGGGQLKKTVQGLKMFNTDEEHPIAGSYTDSGALRFPVDDTLGNRIQAGIFGQYASKNAREYFDNGYAPLKEKQIKEYTDVELPIADYWKYRDGLKGLKTNAEKADYINSLDIKDWQKNLLMNNILDRKEDVDMSNYDDYSNYEEFDYASKNPEKYAFFKDNGISYSDYANADEDGKEAYSWAYNNPEKYKVSKLVAADVVEYRSYTGDLNDIRADKDANGKTISGSAKEKKIEYINNLDLDYGQKIVLFKMQYKTDDTYNADIVNYINELDNLSYDERVTIYTELGFTVKDGYVYWD